MPRKKVIRLIKILVIRNLVVQVVIGWKILIPEPARNEIEFMLANCQRSIDDGDNTWAFMLRELAYVFIVMAFDKL